LATCSIKISGLLTYSFEMLIYSLLLWQVIFKICPTEGPKRYRTSFYKIACSCNVIFYLLGVYYTFEMYLHALIAYSATMLIITCHFNTPQIILILLQSRFYTFRLHYYFTLCWLFNLKQRFNRPDNGTFVPKSGRYYSFMFIHNL